MKFNPQFISHPGSKERLVVLPESQFTLLERLARQHQAAAMEGRTPSPLPQPVLDRIAGGENAVRVIRLWRGLNGQQLSALAGITPSMLSQIERTGKTGSTRTFKAIASVLDVPLDMIFPSSATGDEP